MMQSRRIQDFVSARERIDRRNPMQELTRRATDKKHALYPWAFGVVCLFVAAMNHVRWTDKAADMQESHSAELATLQAKLDRLTPKPQPLSCINYSLHMELSNLEHCSTARSL